MNKNMRTLLQEFIEQHVTPMEQRLALQSQVLGEIAEAASSCRNANDLLALLNNILKRHEIKGISTEPPADTAVARLYSSHINFDIANPENDKEFELLQRTDTVGWWRYNRFFEPVFKCLANTKESSWLTLGDPYGSDAFFMTREGFRSVLPTSIGDHLLVEAKNRGLIQDYRAENAESLSFADNSFDYVLCKEAYHHFPRPGVALYEMLRVAKKAVVLIEPQDPLIDNPVFVDDQPAGYEESGNYVYTLSRRELHKVALGLNLPAVATKGLYDLWFRGASEIPADNGSPAFVDYVNQVNTAEELCLHKKQKHNYLLAILYKERPELDREQLAKHFASGWSITSFPGNPYLTTT